MEQDPYKDESTKEIDADKYQLMMKARLRKIQAEAEEKRLRLEIQMDLGDDAFAGTINGKKVVTHRWKNAYATQRLREDYPELTEHFMQTEVRQVLNMDLFRKQHPMVAQEYQTREFRIV